MSVEVVKYAFTAGELSPNLYGRTDLTKYDLGVAQSQNWYIDYKGGLKSRPGFEFIDFIKEDDKDTKFFRFRFSPDTANTYLILFGQNYVRFIQDGAYVLKTGTKAITAATKANPGVITSATHGLVTGDSIKISGVVGMTQANNRSFDVNVLNANTFNLIDPVSGLLVDTSAWGTYVSGGVFSTVYTLATPYAASNLALLSGSQIRDTLRLTHPKFPIKNLTRVDHNNWTLTDEVIGNNSAIPTNLSAVATGSYTASVVYRVSAVYEDGTESSASFPLRLSGIVNFTQVAGSVTVSWDMIPDAVRYNVYRSYVSSVGAKVSAGAQVGYLGNTRGTFFVDPNINPDFTRAPYDHYDPFALGAIEKITLTAPGSAYTASRVTINVAGSGGSGSGFIGYGIVDESGAVSGVSIVRRGSGYIAPVTVSFSLISGTGSGAAATATVSPDTGVYPRISTMFQQRQVYAASEAKPLTVWASQVGRFRNFDTSQQVVENDSYEFEVDSAEVAPIKHLFAMRGGLLMLSQSGVWLLTGGPQSGAVTPINALADPQSYTGVSDVPPLKIGPDLLYIEGKGYSVRLLAYNDLSKVYSGEDKSLLSSHLFGPDMQIVSWCFAENPGKVVWGVRSDGRLVSMTAVKEQEVYAWTWSQTYGQFKDIISLEEGDYDRVYVAVRRRINGKWRKYLERMAIRDVPHVEDAWAVDSGLRLAPPTVATTLDISPEFADGTVYKVTLTAGSSIFTGKEGYAVRASGGYFLIDSVTSGTIAIARVIRSATNYMPESVVKEVFQAAPDGWTMALPTKVISGLWHLENQIVSILGDGNVYEPQTVVNGGITLDVGVTLCCVGLKYRCLAKTLPPTVSQTPIESKRKRQLTLGVRLSETRGLMVGIDPDNLYPMRERMNEAWGTPVLLQNNYHYVSLDQDWSEDAPIYFVQDDPLPAMILSLVPDMDVGDENN